MPDFQKMWKSTASSSTDREQQDREPVDNHRYVPGQQDGDRQEMPHTTGSGSESTGSEGGVMDYVDRTGMSAKEVEIVLATVNTALLLGWLYYEVSR